MWGKIIECFEQRLLSRSGERKLRQRILIVGVYPELRHENVAAKTF